MTSSRNHLDERPTDPNDSHAILLDLVGPSRRVLQLGCGSGSLTRWLVAEGCEVTGVALDSEAAGHARQWATEVVVGDLDTLDLGKAFDGRTFEVIFCGDVLGHLRDPGQVLVAARRLLAPGGSVVASVSNVAHGDLRLELLAGRFNYRPTGLLAASNLRFFTRNSLVATLHDAGMVGVDWRTTHRPLGETELAPPVNAAPPAIRDLLEGDPDALTYEFIVKAVPADGSRELEELSTKLASEQLRADRSELENEALRTRADLVSREAEAVRTQLVEVSSGLSLGRAFKSWRGLAPLKAWVQRRRGIQ